MPQIFISYRRKDSEVATGRVYDRLKTRFGQASIFIDVETIPFGLDFRKALQEEVQRCKVLIVIIGPDWLNEQEEDGSRRIDNPNDSVYIEVKTALTRKIPVIPLLVKGAKLPRPTELPEGLEDLPYFNAAKARAGTDFDHDMTRLIREIERHLKKRQDSAPDPLSYRWKYYIGLPIIASLSVAVLAVWLPWSAIIQVMIGWLIPSSETVLYPVAETSAKLVSNGDNSKLEGLTLLSPEYPQPGDHDATYAELKIKGINEFASGSNGYADAIKTFDEIRAVAKNQRDRYKGEENSLEFQAADKALKDPEVLIFRNNATVRYRHQQGETVYTIAAAIPLPSSQDPSFSIGREMLWGIAQAQDKAVNSNSTESSDDSLAMPALNLEVIIANDRNIPGQAGILAQVLAQPERKILAVVGHYLSDSTCQALKEGYKGNTIVISPLSTATSIRRNCDGQNFFRTTSSTEVEVSTLLSHLQAKVESSGKEISEAKVAIFYNDEDFFGDDLFKEFKTQLNEKNVDFYGKTFDLLDPSFNAQVSFNQIGEVDALIVIPDGRNAGRLAFDNAIKVIKNSDNEVILGSNPLYNSEAIALLEGSLGSLEDRLFLASDWHQEACASTFMKKEIEEKYWFGGVNRVTALSYEAVQVLVHTLNAFSSEDLSEVTMERIRSELEGLGGIEESENIVSSHMFQDKSISFAKDSDNDGDRNEIDKRVVVTVEDNVNNPVKVVDDSGCLSDS